MWFINMVIGLFNTDKTNKEVFCNMENVFSCGQQRLLMIKRRLPAIKRHLFIIERHLQVTKRTFPNDKKTSPNDNQITIRRITTQSLKEKTLDA